MKHENNKPNSPELNKDILDELSEDELTDVELDPVSGGVTTTYVEFPPMFIKAKKPRPTIIHPH